MPGSIAGGKLIPESTWAFPDPLQTDPHTDVVALGADLQPATVLQGYARGLFPMHLANERESQVDLQPRFDQLAWWSPNPRGVLPLDAIRVSRSLYKSQKRFTVTCDLHFHEVMRLCQRSHKDGQWITREFLETYSHLHRLGYAHSIEVWNHGGDLVGGLYGIELGGLFAGESMFHLERDASKVGLVHLVEKLKACGGERLLDVQWRTDHLATLGVIEITRSEYMERLQRALPTPACFI